MSVISAFSSPPIAAVTSVAASSAAAASLPVRGSFESALESHKKGVVVDISEEGRAAAEAKETAAGDRLEPEEEAQVAELKGIDVKVRSHEQAHAAAGGGLAGAPSYSYATGPDGERYAVGGSVDIDSSPASEPKATAAKARRVKAAATAPSDPSGQDQAVAAAASQMEMQAVAQMQVDQMKQMGGQGEIGEPVQGGPDGGDRSRGLPMDLNTIARSVLFDGVPEPSAGVAVA